MRGFHFKLVFSVLAVFCVAALGLHTLSQHAEDWSSLLAHAAPMSGQQREKDDLSLDFLEPTPFALLPVEPGIDRGSPGIARSLALGLALPQPTLARPPPETLRFPNLRDR